MRLSSKSGWAAANARSVSSPASKIAASTRSVQVTTVFLMSPAMMVGTFMSVPAPAYRIVRSSPLAPT
ncbi:hypothetical protein [Bilophila wadsworthia]|uniref:hypothetical protein n=1 Tax=Bilophila wadsworthia TaxID=35833 RepID=UPI0022DFEDEB|nr:hypothetical protein [Bilophila wadsworthia]